MQLRVQDEDDIRKNWRLQTMRILTLREVSEHTGIPIGSLRFWIRKGKSPFNFRRLPSGRIVLPEEELKKAIDTLPLHEEKCR